MSGFVIETDCGMPEHNMVAATHDKAVQIVEAIYPGGEWATHDKHPSDGGGEFSVYTLPSDEVTCATVWPCSDASPAEWRRKNELNYNRVMSALWQAKQKVKRPKIYAYVNTETCRRIDAVLPGHEIEEGRRAWQSDDYTAWPHGKRETLRRTELAGYPGRAARAVAELLGWEVAHA